MAKNNNLNELENVLENALEDTLLDILKKERTKYSKIAKDQEYQALLNWSEAVRAFQANEDELSKGRFYIFIKVYAVLVLDMDSKTARELAEMITDKEYAKFVKALNEVDWVSDESKTMSIVSTIIHIVFKYVEEA